MNNIFDALEICLHDIEKGIDIETALKRFPAHAEELRPILKTAVKAMNKSAPAPNADAMRRGRARVLQQASEMREQKAKPRKRMIPIFQRLAIASSLASVLLMSGTGLVNASASALPGENLYPVKRGWENVRLLFIFDKQLRSALENEFENERLTEVDELLSKGLGATVQISGVFMQANGKAYISGIPVLLPSGISLPANGTAVMIIGVTNNQGVITVQTLDSLPEGSVVPEGRPIPVESEAEGDSSAAPLPQPASNKSEDDSKTVFHVEGTLQSISPSMLTVNGHTLYLNPPYISSSAQLCVGMKVEAKGYYDANGKFIVTEMESKGSCSGNGGSGSGDNSGNNNQNNDGSKNENHSGSSNTPDHSGGDENPDSGGGDDHGGGGDN